MAATPHDSTVAAYSVLATGMLASLDTPAGTLFQACPANTHITLQADRRFRLHTPSTTQPLAWLRVFNTLFSAHIVTISLVDKRSVRGRRHSWTVRPSGGATSVNATLDRLIDQVEAVLSPPPVSQPVLRDWREHYDYPTLKAKLQVPLDDFLAQHPFSLKVRNRLNSACSALHTLEDLVNARIVHIRRIRGFGPACLQEVVDHLAQENLWLEMNVYDPAGTMLPIALRSLPDKLSTHLAQTTLTPALSQILQDEGTLYLGQLVRLTDTELVRITGIGHRQLGEIRDYLYSIGLTSGMPTPGWHPPA